MTKPLWPNAVQVLNVNAVGLLHLADDKSTLDGADTLDGPQFVENELLVALHVLHPHFQQVVIAAAGVVALGHLGYALYAVVERLGNLAVDLLQPYLTKHKQPLPQLLGVEHGNVFLDVPPAFQPLLPLEDGSRRQMDGIGQFLGRQLCIFLQGIQNLQVGCV